MNRPLHWSSRGLCLLAVAWLASCQANYRKTAAQIVSQERAGQYAVAAATAATAAKASENDSTSRVIFLLEAGRTA